MNYSSLAKRYLPLAAVVAVQLLIIAVVPSKANNSAGPTAAASGPVQGYSTGGGSSPGGGGSLGNGGSVAGASGGGATGSGGVTSSGGGAATGGSSGGTAAGGGATTGGGTSGGGGGGGGGSVPGAGGVKLDTSHCAGNREFAPSIDFYAPPCTPGPVGAANFNNGGSTYEGVNSKTITIVDYVSNYGTEVNTILQAEGLLETYQDAQVVDKAWQNFINTHYVLWGRQVQIKTYQGQCQSVPPNYNCLLGEMDSVVQTYHPYAVFWNTTLCSACFQRLAQDHVVALGGVGFSDAFAQANAPYYWSAGESSTHIEQAFAKFWCSQLTSHGTNRKVTFAQDKNPAQNFNGQPRVLGVISTNDPDNENTVNNVLVPALNADCGDGGSIAAHHYYYSQDINTAAQQVEAGISAMDTPTNPATDVLCLCDPVAPEFLFEGEQQHNYWPENVLADVQGMGDDSTAQNYGASSSLACPTPSQGCEFDNAFGLVSASPQEPQNNNAGVRTFKLGGGTNLPVTGITALTVWENYNMIASLIENTGPDLTPARMAAAAPSMGTLGGGNSGHYEVGFSAGNYNWTQDAEVAYWDDHRASSYNGVAGTYVPIEGSRFLPNQYTTANEPPIPATRS